MTAIKVKLQAFSSCWFLTLLCLLILSFTTDTQQGSYMEYGLPILYTVEFYYLIFILNMSNKPWPHPISGAFCNKTGAHPISGAFCNSVEQ